MGKSVQSSVLCCSPSAPGQCEAAREDIYNSLENSDTTAILYVICYLHTVRITIILYRKSLIIHLEKFRVLYVIKWKCKFTLGRLNIYIL